MINNDDNIFVLSKEQAVELLAKNLNTNNIKNNDYISFSITLFLLLIICTLAIIGPIIFLILTPVFFIEYVIKKIFEKRDNVNYENDNTSN